MHRGRTRTIGLLAALSLLAVASLTGFAAPASASHPLDILLIVADEEPTDFRASLLAEPGIASADYVDGRTTTPTAAQMSAYDAVVTWSNSDYADSAALGNNLADHYDACGVVTQFLFDTETDEDRRPRGRWESGNYQALQANGGFASAPSTLGTHDASHPLMQGVTDLASDFTGGDLASGATAVAEWANDDPAVAYKGHAVFVSAWLGDDSPAWWSGDFSQIVVNAANWRGGECPHPGAASAEQPRPFAQPQVTPLTPAAPQPRPRARVSVAGTPGGCTASRFRLRVRVGGVSAAAATVRRATVLLDGKRIAQSTRRRFRVAINAARLRSGRHRLRVVVVNSLGRRTTSRRTFTRCARKAQVRRAPRFTG